MKDFAIKALVQIEVSAETGIWEAHNGCSALAGALLISRGLIGTDAREGVERQIGLILGVDRPLPTRATVIPRAVFAEIILKELAPDAKQPKEIGHDVIYTAYVLRAIEVFQIDPWPSLLRGLTTLVRKVRRSGPGWITVNGKNEQRAMPEVGTDLKGNYWEAFADFDRPLPMEVGDMQLGHLLTHGHAIEMLKDFSEQALIEDLDEAFRRRVNALSIANRDQLDRGELPHRTVDPRKATYWKLAETLGSMHGHVLKYAYSFLDLKKDGISGADLQSYGRIVWPGSSVRNMD